MLMDARTMATEVITIDLPVNPVSHLILTVEYYNVTDEATLAEVLAFINRVTVAHLGRSIISLESEDLSGLNAYLYGVGGWRHNPIATDNQDIAFSMIVPFGRFPFCAGECFPASKRGEFQLTLDTTVPATSLDNATISVAAIELLDAVPVSYLKCAGMAVGAPAAVGNLDVDLPIGNKLAAILLRMTTWPAASSKVWGIDDVRLLFDNVELDYVSANAPSLVGEMMLRATIPSRSVAAQGLPAPNNVCWMDFDPDLSAEYLIDTKGASSVKLRNNMGVAEASWVSPVEIVDVGAAV